MGDLVRDILEQILIDLDVKDLIRYKSVCKSWQSIISCPGFIKSHLNQSYKNYHNNKENVPRIPLSRFHCRFKFSCELNNMNLSFKNCLILGFCNGLLCISPTVSDVLVINPSTREEKRVRKPTKLDINYSLCWGFGYDSSSDDYKVVLGFRTVENTTCFQVLTLKTNVWKVVGDVEYRRQSNIGTLCNGALHWLMDVMDGCRFLKTVILSFDLSKEEFKVIPLPDDSRYRWNLDNSLEIVEECLCILGRCGRYYNIWVLRNNNVEQFWELSSLTFMDYEGSINQRSYVSQRGVGSPIFMQSLVSPHVNGTPKKKRQAENSKKNNKLIKREPSKS